MLLDVVKLYINSNLANTYPYFILQALRMFEETIMDGGNLVAVLCKNSKDFDSGTCCNSIGLSQLAKMGEMVDRRLRGKYYLKTQSWHPFALPQDDSINCKFL